MPPRSLKLYGLLLVLSLFACPPKLDDSAQSLSDKLALGGQADLEAPKVQRLSFKRNPFASYLPVPAPSIQDNQSVVFFNTDMNDVKVVGVSISGKRAFALLQGPDGSVQLIQEGMVVGQGQAKVDKILENTIMLKKLTGESQQLPTDIPLKGGVNRDGDNLAYHVQNVPLKDALRLFQKATGLNVKLRSGLDGKVDMHVRNLAWPKLLKRLLQTQKMGYQEQAGSIILQPSTNP